MALSPVPSSVLGCGSQWGAVALDGGVLRSHAQSHWFRSDDVEGLTTPAPVCSLPQNGRGQAVGLGLGGGAGPGQRGWTWAVGLFVLLSWLLPTSPGGPLLAVLIPLLPPSLTQSLSTLVALGSAWGLAHAWSPSPVSESRSGVLLRVCFPTELLVDHPGDRCSMTDQCPRAREGVSGGLSPGPPGTKRQPGPNLLASFARAHPRKCRLAAIPRLRPGWCWTVTSPPGAVPRLLLCREGKG